MRALATATSIENTVASGMRNKPTTSPFKSVTAITMRVVLSSGRRMAARVRAAWANELTMMSFTWAAVMPTPSCGTTR